VDAELATGADHAQRDFAAICDEHFLEHAPELRPSQRFFSNVFQL
jgi:hypothetical protein